MSAVTFTLNYCKVINNIDNQAHKLFEVILGNYFSSLIHSHPTTLFPCEFKNNYNQKQFIIDNLMNVLF